MAPHRCRILGGRSGRDRGRGGGGPRRHHDHLPGVQHIVERDVVQIRQDPDVGARILRNRPERLPRRDGVGCRLRGLDRSGRRLGFLRRRRGWGGPVPGGGGRGIRLDHFA